MTRQLLLILFAILALPASLLAGISPELLRALPADGLLNVLIQQPGSPTSPKATNGHPTEDSAASLAQLAAGVLSQLRGPSASLAADIVDGISAASVVGQYPFAFVLHDIQAVQIENGGHQVSNCQASIILLTRGRNAAVHREIQSWLSARTTSATATLHEAPLGDATAFTLTDTRLPDWASFHWAVIGDHYVLSLGDEAFQSCVRQLTDEKAHGYADDAWLQQAWSRMKPQFTNLLVDINTAALQHNLAPVMDDRVRGVISSLGLADTERALWAVGQEGRAVVAAATYKLEDGNRLIPIAAPLPENSALLAAVPPQATTYAAIEYPPARLITRIVEAWLGSKREKERTNIQAAWDAFEKASNADVDRELLAPLAPPIIIHDYPPHPLGVPLACTILVRRENSQAFQPLFDRLMRQCADWMNPGEDSGGWLSPRWTRSDDGIWFLKFGLAGPGIGLDKHWGVISYSPTAVKQNLDFLANLPPTSAKQDAASKEGKQAE